MTLDDFDARPGSATSLLRTIVGAHLRQIGGFISIADLITLMGAVGVTPANARTAVLRVKTKGLLIAESVAGQTGYRLHPDAVPMLKLGDRRIYSFHQQGDTDPWCLISYSIPETQRDARHQLRRRLAFIGCGTVATGLWICPAHLAGEVEDILLELGLRESATLFITGTPMTAGSLADAAATWWDLGRLAAMHRAFVSHHSATVHSAAVHSTAIANTGVAPAPRLAFARYIAALDEWRMLPYLDPGLPPAALPADWPGFDSVELFENLMAKLADPAAEFVTSAVY